MAVKETGSDRPAQQASLRVCSAEYSPASALGAGISEVKKKNQIQSLKHFAIFLDVTTMQRHILDDVVIYCGKNGFMFFDRIGAFTIAGDMGDIWSKDGNVAGGKKELCLPSPEDKPPQLNFKPKKASDVPKSMKTWSDDNLPIDILLLTTDSCDFLSCFSFLEQPFKSYNFEIGYVYFGRMGDASDQEKLKVALLYCPKGTIAPGGPLIMVQKALRKLGPKAVFLVGTCISLTSEKVKMGDVVISSKLINAEGFITPVSPRLGSLARDAPNGWVAPLENSDELKVQVHCGGDILSQSLTAMCRCGDIFGKYPEAVAIETEGKGVYAAAYDANIEWVIVKGVASYFHQGQSATDEWMSFASTMAASLVAKMLEYPTVFLEWPHCKKEKREKRPLEQSVTPSPKKPAQEIDICGELLRRKYERRAQIRPLLWSKNMTLQLKDVYTRLKIVFIRNVPRKCSEIDVQHIFGSSEKRNTMVLIEGSPGIGKTTFCLKHAYDWANDGMPITFPVFDFVFLLKCRDVDGKIMDAIIEQLLPEDIQKRTGWETFLNFIEGFDNQKRILIILDGLDELPEKSRHDVDKVLNRKIFPFCYVLATTRKGKGIEVRKQFTFDICLEIKGFSEDESFEYIRKHFKDFEASMGERLIDEIKKRPFLKELILVPLHLLLLCAVFEDCEGNLPSSKRQLYQTILTCLLRRHCERHNLKASENDADLEKQFESAIVVIGDHAWKCLLNDRLSFSENELNSWERNEHFGVRGLGLVYKEESLKKLNPQHEYFFFHKTFQEYLAALFIVHHLRRNKFNVSEQVTLTDLTGKFRTVFLFVSGFLDDEADILFRQISEAIQGHWDWSGCYAFLALFFESCRTHAQNGESMVDTICSVFPFPRVLHLSLTGSNDSVWYSVMFLGMCQDYPMKHTPAELHITFEYFCDDSSNLESVYHLPNVKSLTWNIKQPLPEFKKLNKLRYFTSLSALTLPAISDVTGYTVVKDYLTTSTTLEKVTFTLIGETGEGWYKVLDELMAGSSLSSMGLKIYGSLSQPALQAVKNFLSDERRFSLPITIERDLPN